MNPLSLRRTISAMLIFRLGLAIAEPYCKPIAGSPDWPAQSEWQAFNESISGRLIAPVPPGVVCQPLSPLYNNDSCQLLYSQWSNSTFHAQNPFTSDYNDDTCLPSALAPCSAAGYPAYVVNATNAKHVQEGVKFAHKTGVRLIVKGTGHDWPGRFESFLEDLANLALNPLLDPLVETLSRYTRTIFAESKSTMRTSVP